MQKKNYCFPLARCKQSACLRSSVADHLYVNASDGVSICAFTRLRGHLNSQYLTSWRELLSATSAKITRQILYAKVGNNQKKFSPVKNEACMAAFDGMFTKKDKNNPF